MKNVKIMMVATIFSASLLLVGFTNQAYATPLKDTPGHAKLLVKSYGPKTITIVCGEKFCTDKTEAKSFDGIKKEQVKHYKKIVEQYKAMGKWNV